MFEDTKSPLTSMGVIGGSGAFVLGLTQIVGWSVSPADAADLAEAVKGLGVSAMSILAIWGRMRANKRIVLR